MPLFMALSGFFAANLYKKPFLQVVKDKTRQLLLPIFSLACIFFIIRYLCKLVGVSENLFFLNIHPESGFWFLKSAFICSVIYYTVSKTNKYYIPILILTLLLSQFFHNWFQLDIMYPCFVFGALINKKLVWLTNHSFKLMLSLGVIFITMLCFYDATFWQVQSFYDASTHQIDTYALLNQGYIKIYKLIIGISGTLFFISLFEYLSHRIPTTKFGNRIIKYGSYTLGIYLIHEIFIDIYYYFHFKIDGLNFYLFNFVITPILSIIVCLLCIGTIEVIKKNKWANFLLLGSIFPKLISKRTIIFDGINNKWLSR